MKRTAGFALLTTALALGAAAQSSTTSASKSGNMPTQPPAQKTVAVINGETITAEKLDALYAQMPTQAREQYEKAGGKPAFLQNYIRKRLLIQEAYKEGFDKRPEVKNEMQAAQDSALFDTYVRDIVASKIVTDAAIRQYYDQHPKDFATPERVHVRSIVITFGDQGPHARSKQEALDLMTSVARELHNFSMDARAAVPGAAEQARINEFSQLARKYSEDPTAASGGDLGWIGRGQLFPEIEAAAFALPIGVPSGVLESSVGYHMLLVDGKQPAGTQPFELARASIREYLMTGRMSEIMAAVTRLTNELQTSSKIAIFPENIH